MSRKVAIYSNCLFHDDCPTTDFQLLEFVMFPTCFKEANWIVCDFMKMIHATAFCPWTGKPAFHFVAYDSNDMRLFINQSGRQGALILFARLRFSLVGSLEPLHKYEEESIYKPRAEPIG